MSYSRAKKAPANRLKPRKTPSQQRSVSMVDAIVEAAARILERDGFAGYSTNLIAEHAGVSVGSLYQYFPSKDAVTIALMQREAAVLAGEVLAALRIENPEVALRDMIAAAVRNQLRRPILARLLDFEEARLSASLPQSKPASDVRLALTQFLTSNYNIPAKSLHTVATSIMEITRALTDAASRQLHAGRDELERGIEGAVQGYLKAIMSRRER